MKTSTTLSFACLSLGSLFVSVGCTNEESPGDADGVVEGESDTSTDTDTDTSTDTETDTSTDTSTELIGCERVEGDVAAGEPIWALRCGGETAEDIVGLDVDPQGNVIVGFNLGGIGEPFSIGEFEIVPGGSGDIVVVELDPAGEVAWLAHYGGSGAQNVDSMVACGDDLVLGGSYSTIGGLDFGAGPLATEDYFASISGVDGSHRWTREIERVSDDAHMIAGDMDCDAAGNLVVSGGFRTGIDFGAGPLLSNDVYDGYVARFDPSGELEWTRLFDSVGAAYAVGRAVTLTEAGELVVVGQCNGSVDFGGGVVATEGEGMVLAKLDAAGGHVWSEALGGPGLYYGWDVAASPSGELGLVGTFLDQIELGDQLLTNVYPDQPFDTTLYDGYAARLDAAGTPTWSTAIASMQDDDMIGVDFEGDAMIVAGVIDGSLWVREYQGDLQTSEVVVDWVPSTSYFVRHALAPDALYVAASLEDDVELGQQPLESRGGRDLLIAKYAR